MSLGIITKKNDTFTAFRHRIAAVAPSARRFYVSGDQTHEFLAGSQFRVGASLLNNGTYTVNSSVFETSLNRTRLNVAESFAGTTTEGVIDVLDKSIPWLTGDIVVVNSTKFLPPPLRPNTAYYIIRKSNSRFKLAISQADATNGVSVEFTSPGDGFLTIAELESSFRVMGGAGNTGELWFHYAVDKTDIRTFTPPQTIVGMQSLINLVDGYAAFQQDTGMLQGLADSNDFDPLTGRLVTWQLETERFMDWAFGLRNTRMSIKDSYQVVASPSTDVLTFSNSVPMWLSGTSVSLNTTGTMPSPLIAGARYYVALTGTSGQIKLSTSPTASDTSSHIDIATAGSGIISIGMYDRQRAFPRFELNPARNNVWIDTPLGVLANVIDGPYSDIRIQQTLYDQYQRPIDASKVTVYRQDKRNRIAIRPEIGNDIDPIYSNDPYNYIHIGGGHFFIEGYEHFLLLNDYTVDGTLLHDPFFGLSTNKFAVDYFEKKDYTLRPTLGGYYLIDQKFLRNIEGSVSDVQNFYDLLALSEATEAAQHSRALVGYKGRTRFLDMLNVNSKSQFMFYRGMIQQKGSVNSVNAYVNSRRFVDAKVDEFWAWKLATFGDAREQVYPEINLFMTDGRDDLRFEFLGLTESTTGSSDIIAEFRESEAKLFNLVTFKDEVRWKDFPEQKQKIASPLFLDGETTAKVVIYAGSNAPVAGQEQNIDFWLDTDTNLLFSYNTLAANWTQAVTNRVLVEGDNIYFRHNTICDAVRVVKRELVSGDFDNYTTIRMEEGTASGQFKRVDAETIRMAEADFSGVIMVFMINPATSKISPAKLIDTHSDTVVQALPLWHPARGDHSGYALRGIDMTRATDPAHYTVTLNPSADNLSLNAWNQNEVGTVWWDTSYLGYMPYYDDKVYPSTNDRIANWGSLAPWASVRVYEWVRSTVHPSRWTALAEEQANDITISHADKATGTPKTAVFKRTREKYSFTVVDNRIEGPVDTFEEFDVVVFTSTDELPTGIEASVKYVVTDVTGGTTFDLIEYETNEPVEITGVGSGTMYIVPSFSSDDWVKQPILRERIAAPFMIALSNDIASFAGAVTYPYTALPSPTPKIAWIPSDPDAWSAAPEAIDADVVDVYVNGELIEGGVLVEHAGSVLFAELSADLVLNDSDTIDIIRAVHSITIEETEFDPDLQDDGTEFVQWKEDFEYTTNTLTSGGKNTGSVTRTYYYFWVENTTTRDSAIQNDLSVQQIAAQLTEMDSAYMIVQKPKDDPTLVADYTDVDYISQSYRTIPVMYRQVIIRKVMNYIDDNDRYVLRFTRDLTLRDTLDAYNSNMNIKDVHEKWVLFRKEQQSTIDETLWGYLTDALAGYKLDSSGNSIRVPSLDRELYDVAYNTSTRIGLGVDQTFTDRTLGLSTVLKYLNDPNINFAPANIDEFFANYSFDTPENIREAMGVIYATFGAPHVNALWFQVLEDSFSLRGKYEELMKTSWLALHGVRVLEVGGLFDD